MSAPEPRSALHHVAKPGRYGAASEPRIAIAEKRRSLVQLQTRKDRDGDVERAIRAALALELPPPQRASTSANTTAIWIQPGMWLLGAPDHAEGELARMIKAAIGDAASIVDQSHGKTVIALAGARARAVLAKGCRLDLHPRVFMPGHAAVTQVAHIGCILHQLDDTPIYELLVPSSFAETFFGWLTHSAAEYGYEIKPRA